MTNSSTVENHYVDNKQFYAEMQVYIADVRKAEKDGKPEPRIPDCIAKKILLIATNLSFRFNFINYPFREEMVGDAIIVCIKYIKRFNPDKYKSPYSYVNKICWQAFVQRIKREKKYLKTKMRYIHNLSIDSVFSDLQEQDADGIFDNQYIEFLQETYLKDLEEEEKKEVKVEEAPTQTLSEFLEV